MAARRSKKSDKIETLELTESKLKNALLTFDNEESKEIVLKALLFYSKFVRPRAGKGSKLPGYLSYWEKQDIAHDVYVSFLKNGINYDPSKGTPAQFLVGSMKNAAVAYVRRKYMQNVFGGSDEMPVSLSELADRSDESDLDLRKPEVLESLSVEYQREALDKEVDDENGDEDRWTLHPVLISFLSFFRKEILFKLAALASKKEKEKEKERKSENENGDENSSEILNNNHFLKQILKFIVEYIERIPEDEEAVREVREIFLQPEIQEDLLDKHTKKRVSKIIEVLRDSLINLYLKHTGITINDIPTKELNRLKSILRTSLNIARENLDNVFEEERKGR